MIKWLYRVLGWRAGLVFGDTLVVDRWRFLGRNLPRDNQQRNLLDVGCGSGAFSIAAAARGYSVVGLSWDEANNSKAAQRAEWLDLSSRCSFLVWDARRLDSAPLPVGGFDYVINTENIEHIIDDRKLMGDVARLLKPGGWLLLTTPAIDYLPMSEGDMGPFDPIEDGRHVRRGYSKQMLSELCEIAGLRVEHFTFCSGRLSQLSTKLMRTLTGLGLGGIPMQIMMIPVRALSFVFECFPRRGRCYSICMVAYKPRFPNSTRGGEGWVSRSMT